MDLGGIDRREKLSATKLHVAQYVVAAVLVVLGFTFQLAAQYVSNYLNRLPEDLMVVGRLIGGQ